MTPDKLLKSARSHADEVRALINQSCGPAACCGLDLHLYKLSLGVKHGGDRKSKPHDADLIRWQDVVQEQVGISDDTARRWMQMGIGALGQLQTTEAAYLEMTETQRAAVKAKLCRLTEGKSQLDFFRELAQFSRGGATHHDGSKRRTDKLALAQGPEAAVAAKRAQATTALESLTLAVNAALKLREDWPLVDGAILKQLGGRLVDVRTALKPLIG
jgi:hypothetical protein